MMFYGTPLLPRRVQHILNKNPAAQSGVIYQYMGDRPNELAIL